VRNRRNPRRARNRVLKIKRHILLSLISRVMMKNLYLRVLLFLLSLISREYDATTKSRLFLASFVKITHQSVQYVLSIYKNKSFGARTILSDGISQSRIAKIVLLWNSSVNRSEQRFTQEFQSSTYAPCWNTFSSADLRRLIYASGVEYVTVCFHTWHTCLRNSSRKCPSTNRKIAISWIPYLHFHVLLRSLL